MVIKQLDMDFKIIQSVNEKKGPTGLPSKLVTAKDFYDTYMGIINYTVNMYKNEFIGPMQENPSLQGGDELHCKLF